MAIPITDKHVHEPRPEIGFGIDGMAVGVLKALQQACRAGDSSGSGKARFPIRTLDWSDLDPPEKSSEVFSEFSEGWVVRHHDQRGVSVEHVGGLQQRSDHHGTEREERSHLVLEDPSGERLSQRRVQRASGVLINAPEVVGHSVRTTESQGPGLEASTPA